jgi:hypothetical protein
MKTLVVSLLLGASLAASTATGETDDERAARLARAAHSKADAFAKLPRLDYQVQYRYGVVDTLRAVDATLETMGARSHRTLSAMRTGSTMSAGFSWDEKRLISELRPGKIRSPLSISFSGLRATRGLVMRERITRPGVSFAELASVEFGTTRKTSRQSSISLLPIRRLSAAHSTPLLVGSEPAEEAPTRCLLAKLDEVVWKYLGTETVAVKKGARSSRLRT